MINLKRNSHDAHDDVERAMTQALNDAPELVHTLSEPGFYCIDQGEAGSILVDDYEEELDKSLKKILRVVKVARGFPDHAPAKVTVWRRMERIQLTSMGRLLMECGSSIARISALKDDVELHPHVKAFLEAASASRTNDPAQWDLEERLVHREARLINEFYSNLAQHATSKELKKKIDNYNRVAHKNYAQAVELIEAHFQQHATLLVCRIDLYYSTKIIWDLGQKVPTDAQAIKDLDALIAHAKSTFKGYLAHAVKCELGLRRGLHFHVLLIFNASLHRQDITIVHQIGLYWQNTITAGTGGFHNCNGHKQRYKHLALGQVHYADQQAKAGLHHILRYLNKIDPPFKHKLEGGLHAFRKSKIPKTARSRSVKRGRPRQKTVKKNQSS